LVSSLTISNAIAANVTNVSEESFQQSGKDAFWVVSVSCDDDQGERTVQRNADADLWCPKGAESSLCNEDKSIAANNACSGDYQAQSAVLAEKAAEQRRQRRAAAAQAAVREKEAAEQAIREAELALQAKILLEEELLSIEQKRLEFSQRELEIDRRIVEIDEALSTEDDI